MLLRKTVLFIVLFSVSIPELAFAQPGDPGGDPDVVPISGLIYLILGGISLGFYKIRNGFNKK